MGSTHGYEGGKRGPTYGFKVLSGNECSRGLPSTAFGSLIPLHSIGLLLLVLLPGALVTLVCNPPGPLPPLLLAGAEGTFPDADPDPGPAK